MKIIKGYSYYSRTRKPIPEAAKFHKGMYAVTVLAEANELNGCAHVKEVDLADAPESMLEMLTSMNHPCTVTCYSKFPFSCVSLNEENVYTFKFSDEIVNIGNGDEISIAYDEGSNEFGNFGIAKQILLKEFKEYEQTNYFA